MNILIKQELTLSVCLIDGEIETECFHPDQLVEDVIVGKESEGFITIEFCDESSAPVPVDSFVEDVCEECGKDKRYFLKSVGSSLDEVYGCTECE